MPAQHGAVDGGYAPVIMGRLGMIRATAIFVCLAAGAWAQTPASQVALPEWWRAAHVEAAERVLRQNSSRFRDEPAKALLHGFAILEEGYGAGHPDLAHALLALAVVQAEGERDLAAAHGSCERLKEIQRKAPEDHLDRALYFRCREKLAEAKLDRAGAKKAQELAESIEWTSSGSTQRELAAALKTAEAGDTEAARRALQILRSARLAAFGPDHLLTLQATYELARLERLGGRFDVAAALADEVDAAHGRVFRPFAERQRTNARMLRVAALLDQGDALNAAWLMRRIPRKRPRGEQFLVGETVTPIRDWEQVQQAVAQRAYEASLRREFTGWTHEMFELRMMELALPLVIASEGPGDPSAEGELQALMTAWKGPESTAEEERFRTLVTDSLEDAMRRYAPYQWQRFSFFRCRARQAGGKTNLKSIWVAQRNFHQEHGRFGSLLEIGFQVPGPGFYRYELADRSQSTFEVRAVGEGVMHGDEWVVSALEADPRNTKPLCDTPMDPFAGEPAPSDERDRAIRDVRRLLLESQRASEQSVVESLRYAREARTRAERAGIRETAYGIATIGTIAVGSVQLGDFAVAEVEAREAIELRRRVFGPDDVPASALAVELARIYLARGDAARAAAECEQALALLQQTRGGEGQQAAYAQERLAEARSQLGQPEVARALLEQAVDTLEILHGSSGPLGRQYDRLGALYGELGAPALAEGMHWLAQAVLAREKSAEISAASGAALHLAEIKGARGDLAAALGETHQVIRGWSNAGVSEHPDVARAYSVAARALLRSGRPRSALLFFAQAAFIEEQLAPHNLAIGGEEQKRLFAATLERTMQEVVELQRSELADAPQAVELAAMLVLQRKGRVLDAVNDRQRAARARLPPDQRKKHDELNQLRAELSRMQYETSKARDRLPRLETRTAVMRRAFELERELNDRVASADEGQPPATLGAVTRTLPGDAALVEFLRTRREGSAPRYVAYVIRPDRVVRAVDLGEAERIDAGVELVRRAIVSRDLKVKEVARRVDALLMQPVRSALAGTEQTLFLAPDGALNLLPFAALVDEKGQFLLERFTLIHLGSGRDLLARMSGLEPDAVAEKSDPLLVGGVDFDVAGGSEDFAVRTPTPGPSSESHAPNRAPRLGALRFQQLPGSAAEVARIREILGLSVDRVLTDRRATETALKSIRSPRVLHVATHGFFLTGDQERAETAVETSLLRSGLALAGSNARQGGSGEDGVLTALEITGLELSGTELVVLSACETGLGTVRAGEGVYGLRRALTIAGARAQAVSLWSVSDAATAELMSRFYAARKQGDRTAGALRDVQRAFARGEVIAAGQGGKRAVAGEEEASEDWSHPFFWAAFLYSGPPDGGTLKTAAGAAETWEVFVDLLGQSLSSAAGGWVQQRVWSEAWTAFPNEGESAQREAWADQQRNALLQEAAFRSSIASERSHRAEFWSRAYEEIFRGASLLTAFRDLETMIHFGAGIGGVQIEPTEGHRAEKTITAFERELAGELRVHLASLNTARGEDAWGDVELLSQVLAEEHAWPALHRDLVGKHAKGLVGPLKRSQCLSAQAEIQRELRSASMLIEDKAAGDARRVVRSWKLPYVATVKGKTGSYRIRAAGKGVAVGDLWEVGPAHEPRHLRDGCVR